MKKIVTVTFAATWLMSACAGERPANLGATNGNLAACPDSPNCVSSQTGDERHRIAPFATGDDPGAAFTRLTRIIKGRPDATVIDETAIYLRVELHTRLFTDDAEFLLDREHRLIHLRSASRIGYSDLGLNRRRIEQIREQFQTGR